MLIEPNYEPIMKKKVSYPVLPPSAPQHTLMLENLFLVRNKEKENKSKKCVA